MTSSSPPTTWRALAVAVGAVVATASLGRLLRPELASGRDALRTDGAWSEALLGGAAVLLMGCAVWFTVVTCVVVAETMLGHTGRTRGVPPAVRRLVLAACGCGLSAAATVSPAVATPGGIEVDRGSRGAEAVAPLQPIPAPPRPPDQAPTPAGSHVVVTPGDSLWTIARQRLDSTADDAEVLRAVRAIAAANADVVSDPDLIHPGQRLRTPLT